MKESSWDDDGHEITKGFKPASSERVEGLFLKDASVEGVSVVDEVLKMFEG